MEPDIQQMIIGIAGLGLIGGSMALALREQHIQVLGYDRSASVLELVRQSVAAEPVSSLSRLCEADLVVLALPPDALFTVLGELLPLLRPGTVVTDVCGVKGAVVEHCEPLCRQAGLRFLGGHPMAGRERGGFEHATHNLFRGSSYILTPTPNTPPEAVDLLRQLAEVLGCAGCTVTTPAHHDEMIAFTSQLPHVLAGAYVQSPCCPRHRGYSAGSYRDVSRVAAIDETLWSQLFLLNREALSTELGGLIDRLTEARTALDKGDAGEIAHIIRRGRLVKEHLKE